MPFIQWDCYLLKTKPCPDANFVVTGSMSGCCNSTTIATIEGDAKFVFIGGTSSCHNDNSQYHQ